VDDGVEKNLPAKMTAREEPCGGETQWQAEADARQPDAQAELEGAGFEGRERQGVPRYVDSAGGVQPLEASLEIADEVADILETRMKA